LNIEIDESSEDEARTLANNLGLTLPPLPANNGLEVTTAGTIDDADYRGLTVQLSSSGRDGPFLAIQLTPIEDCFPQMGSGLASEMDGVNVYRNDHGSTVGYVASFELTEGDGFVEATFGWPKIAAPGEDERLAFVAASLEDLRSN
jgi:hypothetical protein